MHQNSMNVPAAAAMSCEDISEGWCDDDAEEEDGGSDILNGGLTHDGKAGGFMSQGEGG